MSKTRILKDLKISVIILTFNEEIHIERCIKSINKNVDEIIIIDNFSTDKTIEICSKYKKVRFYKHKFKNHANQLNWAIRNLKIKSKWLIRIDADEIVEKNFFKKVKKIKNLEKYNAMNIIIEHNFLGKRINYGGVYPQYQIRMWKKGLGFFDNKPMDEKLIIKRNNILKSNLKIIDHNLNGLKFWFLKHSRYAKQEAKLHKFLINKKIKINRYDKKFLNKITYYKFPIFLRPILLFIYRFFLKKGFLDGFNGLKFNFLQTLYYRFLVDIYIAKNFFIKKNN